MAEATDHTLVEVECAGNTRAMSPSEIFHFNLNRMEPKNGTYVHAHIFNSSNSISTENVRKSLHEVAMLHYLLQTYVFKDDKGDYFFREMENTDVNSDWIQLQFLSANHTSDWVEIVNKDMKTKLDFENGPLWRVIWVTCSTGVPDQFSYCLIFICSHCIMDARCCVDLFANQFLPILNGFVTGKEFQFEKKPIFLAKSNEDIFFHHGSQKMLSEYSVPWYIHYGVSFALRYFRTITPSTKKPDMRVAEERQSGVDFGLYLFDLDLKTSIKLQYVCKENLVSVHSVLMTILAYSLKRLEDKFECYRANFKKINFPIDSRKFKKQLNETPQPVGVYTFGRLESIKFINPTDTSLFFKFCKNLTAKIKSANKIEERSKLLSVFVEFTKGNRLSKMMDCLPFNLSLSNLGNCDAFVKSDPSGSVKLVGQYYGIIVSTNSIFVTTTTLNKQMTFCICYGAGWLNEEFAEALAANIKECCESL